MFTGRILKIMTPRAFVDALADIELDGVFNPYRHRCSIYDLLDGPAVRRRNLRRYLQAIDDLRIDTIWMGRDLGYRGGRRTGLALTDEVHLANLGHVYPGADPARATKGPPVAERTAAEIWSILGRLRQPPLLWNVFPFHPYGPGSEMSNRRFSARELATVSELNFQLVAWLGIKRIICIGQDASTYAKSCGVNVECVRHPSYGGTTEFREGMQRIYGRELRTLSGHPELF